MAFDGSSGGMIRLVNVTKEGFNREIVRFDELTYTK
jgi:hypothetical protein